MNKAELLEDLRAKDFIGSADFNGVADIVDEKKDRKASQVDVEEIVGKAMRRYTVTVYVIDEGKETESAFYKDKEPEQTIKENGTE